MIILVLESSTTSAKAMLYCTKTGVIKLLTREYPAEYNDTISQDSEGVFIQTALLGKEISQGYQIDIIALSSAWHSLVLCDKNGVPKTRVLSWANTAAAGICNDLRRDSQEASTYYHKTGCLVNAMYPYFKLLYLKEQGYALRDYLIFGQGSYNTFRLTGRRIVSESMASGSGLLDIHSKQYDLEILDHIGIDREQLCEVVSYRDTVPLSVEGARLLGLKEGIPVIPAYPDGALNQVGAGAIEEGSMTFSVGTSAALRFAAAKPRIPDRPSTWCYLAPSSWLIGAATSGACNCTDWVKSRIFPEQISYEELEGGRVSEDTPFFLPFLFGERSPGWQEERKGAWLGMLPKHTNRDLYLATQEGILYLAYQCYQELKKLNGTPKRIMLSGGILKSPAWTQMCLDIFQLPMEIPTQSQSSLMGAVVLAYERLGLISAFEEFPFETGKLLQPNQELSELYQRRFELYQDFYQRLN